jgi:uncharacterized protein (TIGR03492 family)
VVAEASGLQRLLFISNGHGEDWISAAIIKSLPRDFEVDAYPMVGSGGAYLGVCPIVGPRASVESGGARTAKGSLRKDIASGGLGTIPPALKFLRESRKHYQRIIIVGDMTGVIAAYLMGLRNLIYIDVYKTGAARLYSKAERFVIKRSCTKVICRADNLAALLREDGVDAIGVGNVMLDTIPYGNYDARSRRTKPLAVTLLPGSRGPTRDNFVLQVKALQLLPDALIPDVFLAVAGGIDVAELADLSGLARSPILSSESADLGVLTDGRLTIHMAHGGAMGNLLEASDLVLSQAGTATTQSLGLGRPSITFISKSDRRSRFDAEQRYFGEARVETAATPEAISDTMRRLLENDAERLRLGEVGRNNIGAPGAINAILQVIAE